MQQKNQREKGGLRVGTKNETVIVIDKIINDIVLLSL